MKTQHFVLSLICLLVSIVTLNAQKPVPANAKKESIKVWGECGMCKKKIENASKAAGATTASWNENNKLLTVSYNSNATSLVKIQEAVAAAGYDTKDMAATAEAYDKLPECCHYERKTAGKQ